MKLRNAVEADRNKVFALKVLRKVEGEFKPKAKSIISTDKNLLSGQIKTSRPCES